MYLLPELAQGGRGWEEKDRKFPFRPAASVSRPEHSFACERRITGFDPKGVAHKLTLRGLRLLHRADRQRHVPLHRQFPGHRRGLWRPLIRGRAGSDFMTIQSKPYAI